MKRAWLAALLLCGATAQAAPVLKSGVFSPARAAPEIALKAADGSDFRLSALRGRVVVVEFGFTHCAAVCPATLAALAQAQQKLGPHAERMQVLFISVDPERDTPARLKTYLAQFDKRFIGITGTLEQMAAIRKDYGITATRHPMGDSKLEYQVGHSSYLYFIDKKGMLRALLPFGRPADDIVHDVNVLAAE
ncbi:SCO family protein [Massilia yuzhufengensis]|uniref:Protein SCO1/2 n=1 Tax=Massilia yuzhufengensis TaxID=1164594 RepID=A0A1I1I941_9BURK|nr:SCO family protein [Massilia yuzhufengensis]SFC32716.1 protein SCO1/2 [Massilia yuzhufengensis]